MKNIFKIGSVALGMSAVLIAGSGCNKIKDFGTTNVNPGTTATPITAALLTNVLSGLGGGYALSIRGGQYAQYFSETQYPGSSLYTAPILSFYADYTGALYDLQNIINQNTNPLTKSTNSVLSYGSNANQIAVARILKAYIYWTVTDRWGDVPYFDALKGLTPENAPSGTYQIKYDKQSDIYPDLIKELKEAVAQFDANAGVKGDIMFNPTNAAVTVPTTQTNKWKKFANSLRLLISLRTSKVFPNAGQWAATEFNAALADAAGTFTANTDNAIVTYPGSAAGFSHPLYASYVTSSRRDDAESKTMTDTLSAYADPRLASYGTTVNGFPYGLDRPHATQITTGIAYILKGPSTPSTEPITILNAATVLFARAEAAERGWTLENAGTLYAQAVTASFTQFGYTAAQATTYMLQPNIGYGLGGSNLRKIGTQRWIAMYPDGWQAWFEWRRTGYPALTPSAYATNTGGQIPRRYVYNTDEYSYNNAAVVAAAALISGGDKQDSRVWWDK
jgi:hypothetical protein